MRKNTYFLYLSAFLFAATLLILGSGCAKEKADMPTWIEVDSIKLNAQPGAGSSNSRFTDVWLYANSNLVGGFELPARVPVLANGNTNIILIPGIQLNGLTGLRAPYLKVQRFEENLNLVPGETIKLNPVLQYDTTVLDHLLLIEGFENQASSFVLSNGSAGEYVTFSSSPAVAFEGNGCAMVRHTGAENTIAQIEAFNWITIPKGDAGVFFEMNYKSNTSFTVSLLCKPLDGPTQKVGVIGINPTSGEWKKIYITLSPTVNSFTTGNQFKPVIGYARQADIPSQEVYIDNIKVLY